MQWPWMLFQFAVSVVAGCAALLFLRQTDPQSTGNLIWAVIIGLIAARLAMFLITWARFGWKAARTMRMSG